MRAFYQTYPKRPAGHVCSASLLWAEAGLVKHKASRGRSVAQNAGLRFEAKVSKALYSQSPGFVAQVPFSYYAEGRHGKCILDGLIFFHPGMPPSTACLVEVKHRFTGDGWYQLRHLYHPVAARALPGRKLKLLEICKVFEPETKVGEPFKLWPKLDDFIRSSAEYGVLCWR